MDNARVFAMAFASVYPHYVAKVERKGRTRAELDEVIGWLTGYGAKDLARVLAQRTDFATFFGQAPRLNPKAVEITGTICGVRIEAIEDPLMQKIRWLDKLVDELAQGRPMEKVLRQVEAGPRAGKARAALAQGVKPKGKAKGTPKGAQQKARAAAKPARRAPRA